jgi:protein TonB
MNGLRSLLRLEDKVAAEGRRIQNLGGSSMRWAAPLALLVAFGVHAAVLLLPAARIPPVPPASTRVPDFPRVWRVAPADLPSSPRPAERPTPLVPETPTPDLAPPPPGIAPRELATEPLPEPPPPLALNMISANVEAIIPNPDALPPVREFGPPSSVAPPMPDQPSLVERVSPAYPVAARSLRAEGRVTLRLEVLPDGSVGGATVEECTRKGLGFESAALDAVKRWRYEPAPQQTGVRKVVVSIHFQQHEARP